MNRRAGVDRKVDRKEEWLSAEELAEIDEAGEEIKAGEWFTLQQIMQENDLS